ncbi:hypothetical protein SBA4_1350019 [Candidatus Sulfopaludibacter sp. SbA4]|nr:hypothetical protein SBA4_1350019 [Candidatus Sulfopaludibacter sp. SbA4]
MLSASAAPPSDSLLSNPVTRNYVLYIQTDCIGKCVVGGTHAGTGCTNLPPPGGGN